MAVMLHKDRFTVGGIDMAQYNDLFGFDRFARAQDMAQQWQRQQRQDDMALSRMQESQRRNALTERYAEEDRATKLNAMTQQRGAENFAYQNVPFLQGQPDIYGEQSGVLMQDLAKNYPGANLGSIQTGLAGMQPKVDAPKIENFDGVPYIIDGDKPIRIAPGYSPKPTKTVTSGSHDGSPVVGMTGTDPMQGISPGDAAIVKKIANYEMQLPSGMALKTPYWQNILGRVALLKPEFDATQYNVRQKLKNDFTSGKAAVNIRGLNTAVGHLDTLTTKLAALENSDYPTWNQVANATISAVGDPRVKGADVAATAVESELASVFKGMGATDQEIKAWRANFDANGSPAQQKEAIQSAIELLGGRLEALTSQYEGGLGEPKNFRLLNEKSRKILTRLGADIDALDPVTGAEPPLDAKQHNLQNNIQKLSDADLLKALGGK